MSRENPFPGLVVAAAVPSLALIATQHASLGAVVIGGALAAWIAHAGMRIRADRFWETRLLDYAQATTNLGGDPTGVITALRPRPIPAADRDAGLFRPDDDHRPWVHLPPSEM
jgi:hypothetical protein